MHLMSSSGDIIISFDLYEFENHKVIFSFDFKAVFSDSFWHCLGHSGNRNSVLGIIVFGPKASVPL